ncbi:hypothetical protein WEN_00405 [Mycoplasma wenyonii str. Massachusetts]|uniref:Uncharacterized protein n=1 Tax=Mycoplasma wenyonii (strain Massachusetts) TaxID=1197325 RepID=I6Z5Q2_MYCWM|nr:hypothetical protein [Mycoplasma wenyonii]AFN64888.1 hypothetical protein WEN_00405 [Mycoplasma wenyonii str. Massachusetts]
MRPTKNSIRHRKHPFNARHSERNIYKALSSCVRKKKCYLYKELVFERYKERILSVAIFLFTTSPFLFRRKSDNLFNFHWRKYTQIFSKKDKIQLLNCSVLYLLENSQFSKTDEKKIRDFLPKPIPSFNENYFLIIMKKKSEDNDFNPLSLKFNKYLKLISISLRLFEIIRYEISKDYSKVLELVELSHIWKEKISDIFGFKSEYINFLYFLNLKRKRRSGWSD